MGNLAPAKMKVWRCGHNQTCHTYRTIVSLRMAGIARYPPLRPGAVLIRFLTGAHPACAYYLIFKGRKNRAEGCLKKLPGKEFAPAREADEKESKKKRPASQCILNEWPPADNSNKLSVVEIYIIGQNSILQKPCREKSLKYFTFFIYFC
jgi:hypothetical protein